MATNVTKGTRLSKPRDDQSVNFRLNGGPFDGMVVRVYPDNPKEVRKKMAPIWPDIRIDGHLYEMPSDRDQSDTKPYATHRSIK